MLLGHSPLRYKVTKNFYMRHFIQLEQIAYLHLYAPRICFCLAFHLNSQKCYLSTQRTPDLWLIPLCLDISGYFSVSKSFWNTFTFTIPLLLTYLGWIVGQLQICRRSRPSSIRPLLELFCIACGTSCTAYGLGESLFLKWWDKVNRGPVILISLHFG